MNALWFQRIKSLFLDALEQPQAERGAFLQAACGEDAELRAELEGIRAGYDPSSDFLEPPPPRHRVFPLRPWRC